MSVFYNKKKKDARYQLADYYTAFYYRYIKNNYGKDEHFWSNAIDNPARRAWAGLTFEQVCKDHVPQIRQKLGISGMLSEEFAYFTEKARCQKHRAGYPIQIESCSNNSEIAVSSASSGCQP